MSGIRFPEYLQGIQNTLNEVIAGGQALTVQLQADQRSTTQGFLAEFLHLWMAQSCTSASTSTLPRQMYAYHYQDATAQMIFRYDNAAHRPPLSAREHKHTPDNIVVILPPTLEQVIDEILKDQ